MLIIISAIIEFLVSVIQIGVSCTNCMSSAVLPLCQIGGYCSLFDIKIMLLWTKIGAIIDIHVPLIQIWPSCTICRLLKKHYYNHDMVNR